MLAFGLVSDRFEYWPFIIPGLLIGLPLLFLLLWKQTKSNTMSVMLYGYVIFLLAFAYVSRFLQPNYLGFLLGIVTLAVFLPDNELESTNTD